METVVQVMREVVCIKMFIYLFVLWMIVQNRHVLITGAHDRIIADAEQQKISPAVSKPNITGWKLNGHYLIVNWNHSDVNKQVHGYYVLLCRVVDSQCTGPDFINFGANIKSGRIIGLAPETTYQVEVIAYSSEEHVSSDPVIVNTKSLQFLLARNLSVSLVTCCSAVFQWKHEPKNNVHDVQFKLDCKGHRQYVDVHKKLIEEKYHFEHLSYSTSKDTEIFIHNKLEPNAKYLCSMSSISGTIQSPPSQRIKFTTLPGIPSVPPTPILSLSHDNTFTAKLYPTDERFGAISHYLLIAVPVTKSKNDPLTTPYEPVVPIKNLLAKALSSKMVTKVSQPLPFVVSSFGPADIPINYNFGYEWRSVFKQKKHYSVVLAAFTEGRKSNAYHSFSALSSPVYITEDLFEAWLEKQRPVAKRFTFIVVSCIIAVAILFSILFLVLFITNYYHAKRKDKENYEFSISGSESSDEEIFSKEKSSNEMDEVRPMASKGVEKMRSTTTRVRQVTTLSEKSPNMTHADWAFENMSSNPAFRNMIDKHPEALDEMNDVMAKIGHQWEVNKCTYSDVKHTTSKKIRDGASDSGSSLSEPIFSNANPPPVPPRLHPETHPHHHNRHKSHGSRAGSSNRRLSPNYRRYTIVERNSMSDVDLTGEH